MVKGGRARSGNSSLFCRRRSVRTLPVSATASGGKGITYVDPVTKLPEQEMSPAAQVKNEKPAEDANKAARAAQTRLETKLRETLAPHGKTLQEWGKSQNWDAAKNGLLSAVRSYTGEKNGNVMVSPLGEDKCRIEVINDDRLVFRADIALGKDGGVSGSKIMLLSPELAVNSGMVDPIGLGLLMRRRGGTSLQPPGTDPTLKDIVPAFNELNSLPSFGSSEYAKRTQMRAEVAGLLSRHLAQTGKEPTRENLREAYETITRNQKAYRDLNLFSGATILVGAHMQSQYGAGTAPGQPVNTPRSIEKCVRTSGDERLFGKEKLMEALAAQAGSKDRVHRVRPEYGPMLEMEKMNHLTSKYAPTLLNWSKGGEDAEYEKAFIADAERLFGAKGLTVQREELPDGFVKLNLRADGRVLPSVSLSQVKEGIASRVEHTAFNENAFKESVKAAKEELKQRFINTPPTNGKFVFLFDGHGSKTHLHLSGGIPIQTPEGIQVKSSGDFSTISKEELGEWLNERAAKFPPKPGENPVACVLVACLSGNFAHDAASLVQDKKAQPVFLTITELNEFGHVDPSHPLGSRFAELVIDPRGHYAKEPVQHEQENNEGDLIVTEDPNKRSMNFKFPDFKATLGEIMDVLRELPAGLKNNPTITVPRQDSKPDEPPWLQIS